MKRFCKHLFALLVPLLWHTAAAAITTSPAGLPFGVDPVVIEQGDQNAALNRMQDEAPRVYALNFDQPQVDIRRILNGGIVVDEIPTLTQPQFLPVGVALEDGLYSGDDYAVGVDVSGELRFYPLRILNWHQGVNDVVGGVPVFVSWDPLSGQAATWRRDVNGTGQPPATFGVSGLVFRSGTLYYDNHSYGLWLPAQRRAITGALSGKPMATFPTFVVQLKQVVADFPEAKILTPETGYLRDYNSNPYGDYPRNTELLFPVQYHDISVPRKEYVLGVILRRGNTEKHIAFPMATLMSWQNGKGLNFTFGSPVLGVKPLPMTVHYMAPFGRFEVTTPDPSVTVETHLSYWFSWSAYHPNSKVVRYLEPQH